MTMAATIKSNVTGIRKFLRYHGIKISNEGFKERVTLPLVEQIPDVPLERETVRKILLSDMPLWIRGLFGVMKDAGTRIGETMQIRVSDIHFDESSVRIHVRRETTKACCLRGVMTVP
jgi:integrase